MLNKAKCMAISDASYFCIFSLVPAVSQFPFMSLQYHVFFPFTLLLYFVRQPHLTFIFHNIIFVSLGILDLVVIAVFSKGHLNDIVFERGDQIADNRQIVCLYYIFRRINILQCIDFVFYFDRLW